MTIELVASFLIGLPLGYFAVDAIPWLLRRIFR